MPTAKRRANLLEGKRYSRIQSEVQASTHQITVACAGRRVGKTEGMGTPTVMRWMHEDLSRMAADITAGKRRRWAGEGMGRKDARYIQPDAVYWIVAPRETHLDEARGHILKAYTGDCANLLHPTFGGIYNKGKQLWVEYEGVVGRYDFICAASETGLVSKSLRGVWLDECGFIPNERFQALKPALWDQAGRIIATGTPSFGEDHWFTKLAVSGLSEGHPRYDPRSPHDPRVRTFIADTIHHAFLESARRGAQIDIQHFGPIWAAQWVWADWRRRVLSVYAEWSESVHVADFRRGRRGHWELNGFEISEPPTYRDAIVDWSGGTAPGAAVVDYVWATNPLDPTDPRPLVVTVDDLESHAAYTSDPAGWWSMLRALDDEWNVDRWYGDPHSPKLIERANAAGIPIQEGAHQDKMGRISLMAGLLHYDRDHGVAPAYYCSSRAANTAKQFANYRWRVTRSGDVTAKPRDSDDHCLDCLAMHVSEIYDGGGTQIGGTLYL